MSSIMKFAYNLAKGKKEIFKTKSVWWQNINYFLFDEMQKKERKGSYESQVLHSVCGSELSVIFPYC